MDPRIVSYACVYEFNTGCALQNRRCLVGCRSVGLVPIRIHICAITDSEDQSSPPRKISAAIQSIASDFKQHLQHPMCAYVAGDSPLGNTSKPVSPRSIAEVPGARAVVVLMVTSTDGVQKSHAFCIDKKQGILVGAAHGLPPHLQFIVVCLYNPDKMQLEPTFVAKRLIGGVSEVFQDGSNRFQKSVEFRFE